MFNFNNIGLKVMAFETLRAKEDSDPRYTELVTRLMERMSWSKEEVEQGIIALALN